MILRQRPGLRRLIAATTSFALLAFMLGFFKEYHLPRLKKWLLVEIETQSAAHLPVRVWPQRVEFSLFPLGVTIYDVRLLPQGELRAQLAPTSIREISVSPSLVGLFKGRLRVGEISITGADIKYFTPLATDSKEQQTPSNFSLDTLFQLPIDVIELKDVNLWVRLRNPKASMQIQNLSVNIENSFRALLVDIVTPVFRIRPTPESPIVDMSFGSRVLVRDNRIQLSALKIKRGQSYLVASGVAYGNVSTGTIIQSELQAKTTLALEEIREFVGDLMPSLTIPSLKGLTTFTIDLKHKPGEAPQLNFEIEGDKIDVQGYQIGDIAASGMALESGVEFQEILVQNPAGKVRVQDPKINMDLVGLWREGKLPHITTSGKVYVEHLNAQKLFHALKLKGIPVHLGMSGELPCEGSVFPQVAMKCTADLKAQNLNIYTEKEKTKKRFSIVDIAAFSAIGQFAVTTSHLDFRADVKLFESTGKTSGHIDFDKGFDIKFDADIKDIAHIKNLAELKLEGSTKLSGSAQGDSRAATFGMDLEGKNFWLENFGLGNLKTRLDYKSGTMKFKRVDGYFGTTKYQGDVNLDLIKNRVEVTGNLPYFDVQDLTRLMGRKVPVPVVLTGTGAAKLQVTGPLNIPEMSFKLDAHVFRGSIAGEDYDKMFIQAHAVDGTLTTDRVDLFKGSSRVDLRGKLTPDGTIDAVLVGREMRLEQSQILTAADLKLVGQLDWTMALAGAFLKPKVNLSGRISKLIVADQPADDSRFQLNVDEERMQFGGRFIGDSLIVDLIYPRIEQRPFSLKAKARDWNFTKFFGVFSNIAIIRGYEAGLTGDLDLFTSTGNPALATGHLRIDRFNLRRGPIVLRSPEEPMFIHMQNGEWRSQNFKLYGDTSFIELIARPSTTERIDMSINGKIDLALAIIFTPFMEDLRGAFSLSMQIRGPANNLQLLGSGYVQDGFVKLKAMPQVFERINADMFLGRNGLVINALKARVGGGTFAGDGRINFQQEKGVGVDVSGEFTDVSLNVPDGFKTRGSGQLYFRGTNFPYELGGRYQVARADVDKDFSASKEDLATIQPSSFLPKFLAEEVFEPISLNMDIELMQPANVRMLISNAKIEAPVSGSVHVAQSPTLPVLTGRLTSGPPGRVTFRNNVFDIRTAHVDYRGVTADNPTLYLVAETRLRDEYDVTLNIQGTSKKPQIQMASQPPLPEKDLISLLALGITSRDSDSRNLDARRSTDPRSGNDQQAAQVGFEIGGAILKDKLGLNKGLPSKLGLEVDIATRLDDVNNTSVPAVTVRKQWTPKFGASASQTLASTPSNSFRADYRINKNLSVIGTYQDRRPEAQQKQSINNEAQARYGVDLDYRIEFK